MSYQQKRSASVIVPQPVDTLRPLLLASASPRRRELLEAVGLPIFVRVFEVDEARLVDEAVDPYLERIARMKLFAALQGTAEEAPLSVALAADTVVVVDGEALGKPRDARDAVRMLSSLSGRAHDVKTRFAIGVVGRSPEELAASTVTTQVRFRTLSKDAIDRYVATGESFDKAGAYGIQGIGGFAVSRIEGSYSNVVGLPVCEVIEALESIGALPCFPFVSRAIP